MSAKSKMFVMATVILLIIISTNIMALAQSAKDAYKALKKIDAQVKSGVSFVKYSDALADATLEVNMYVDSAESKSNVKYSECVKTALDYYQGAKEIWYGKFKGSERSVSGIFLQYCMSNRELAIYAGKYPVIMSDAVISASVGVCDRPENKEHSKVSRDVAWSALWGEASSELDKAYGYLIK